MLFCCSELRHSFDTVRLETDRQANSHMELSQQMKRDLEQPIADFLAKQAAFKKSVRSNSLSWAALATRLYFRFKVP
jgi:hypothetical protein